jgi:hypothetical protein
MSTQDYVIYDPTVAHEAEPFERAPRAGTLVGRRLALLDNGKPNAARFLGMVAERLSTDAGVSVVRTVRKPSAYRPAGDAELAAVAQGADLVLSGIGD